MFPDLVIQGLRAGEGVGQFLLHVLGDLCLRSCFQPGNAFRIIRSRDFQFRSFRVVFRLLENQLIVIACGRLGSPGRVAFLHGDVNLIVFIVLQDLLGFLDLFIRLLQVVLGIPQQVFIAGQQRSLVSCDSIFRDQRVQIIHIDAAEGVQRLHPVVQGAARLPGAVFPYRIRFFLTVGMEGLDAGLQQVQTVQDVQLRGIDDGENIFRQPDVRVGFYEIFVVDGQDLVQQELQLVIRQFQFRLGILFPEAVGQGYLEPVLVCDLCFLQPGIGFRILCLRQARQHFLGSLAFLGQDRPNGKIRPKCGDRYWL